MVPAVPMQRCIADALSVYDDLIENNTRCAQILEEMARSLYREWFINFRFSQHEAAGWRDSAFGKIPSTWCVNRIGDGAAFVNRGVAPKYDDNAEGLVINQKCIRNQSLSLGPARRHCAKVPPEKYVRVGDVLVNSTGVGTLGRVAQVLEPIEKCTVDTHVTIVRPGERVDSDFWGMALLSKEAHFASQGAGSTGQAELARGRIGEAEIICPPEELQRRFGELVRPMRRLAVALANKNANLRATRDLLLPRLISGELDVSSLPLPPTP
jgi:type I restriction enzyme S subunit